jgi:hypothetical protein
MRMYDNKNVGRSWVIALGYDSEHSVMLDAVDSVTGEWIATLLIFHSDGTVERDVGAYQTIKGDGYDPHEHGNKFDDDGCLIVAE